MKGAVSMEYLEEADAGRIKELIDHLEKINKEISANGK